MKKITALLLAVALLLSFVACAGSKKDADNENENEPYGSLFFLLTTSLHGMIDYLHHRSHTLAIPFVPLFNRRHCLLINWCKRCGCHAIYIHNVHYPFVAKLPY